MKQFALLHGEVVLCMFIGN